MRAPAPHCGTRRAGFLGREPVFRIAAVEITRRPKRERTSLAEPVSQEGAFVATLALCPAPLRVFFFSPRLLNSPSVFFARAFVALFRVIRVAPFPAFQVLW